jgi:hypothetical protein
LDDHWLEGVEGLQHDFPDRSARDLSTHTHNVSHITAR